jgi:hypothetical protein
LEAQVTQLQDSPSDNNFATIKEMPVFNLRFGIFATLTILFAAPTLAVDRNCIRAYTGVGALEIMIGFEKRLDEAVAAIEQGSSFWNSLERAVDRGCRQKVPTRYDTRAV